MAVFGRDLRSHYIVQPSTVFSTTRHLMFPQKDGNLMFPNDDDYIRPVRIYFIAAVIEIRYLAFVNLRWWNEAKGQLMRWNDEAVEATMVFHRRVVGFVAASVQVGLEYMCVRVGPSGSRPWNAGVCVFWVSRYPQFWPRIQLKRAFFLYPSLVFFFFQKALPAQ